MDEVAAESKHAKLAEDSARVCIVTSKTMKNEVLALAAMRHVSASHLLREYIYAGIEREKAKWQTNPSTTSAK